MIRDFRADEKLDARAAQLAKGGANETDSIMLRPVGGGEQAEFNQERKGAQEADHDDECGLELLN